MKAKEKFRTVGWVRQFRKEGDYFKLDLRGVEERTHVLNEEDPKLYTMVRP